MLPGQETLPDQMEPLLGETRKNIDFNAGDFAVLHGQIARVCCQKRS